MSDYKIKLEDKAAFLEKLGKYKVPANSFDFKDNKIENYFEFKTNNPQADEIVKTILKQSPKINKISEMKSKITVSQLREIIREELSEVGYAKKEKQPLKEYVGMSELQQIIATAAVGLPFAALFLYHFLTKKNAQAAIAQAEKESGKTLSDDQKKKITKVVASQAASGVSKAAGGGGE